MEKTIPIVEVYARKLEEEPVIHCPYCGTPVGEEEKCPHLVFGYHSEVGLFSVREDFAKLVLDRLRHKKSDLHEQLEEGSQSTPTEESEEDYELFEQCDYEEVLELFKEFAQDKEGAVIFEVEYWGIACGPVHYIETFGFVANPLKEEKKKETKEDEEEIEKVLVDIRNILNQPKPLPVIEKPYCKKCAYFELCFVG